MSDRSKRIAGALIGVLYATGMTIRAVLEEGPVSAGDVLAGLVGGVLAGILVFMVLRRAEHQRRQRRGQS